METSSKWTDAFLDNKRLIADPEADQVLTQILESEAAGESRRLFDLLIRNIDLPLDTFPDSVRAFLEKTNQLPAWTDWKKIERAHLLFLDHGAKFLFFLYFKSLPLLYSCKNGAAVLVKTSRLTHKQQNLEIFTRRIAETGQFLVNVMTPGALRQGGKGILSIQKVRLIHAAIRHFLLEGEWDTARLGRPINQEDLAVTLMTFSISVLDGLHQFNIEVTSEDKDAYIHTWKTIGVLLGINEDLLPENAVEARLLLDRILTRQSAASEDGRLLTRALIQFSEKTIPKDRLDNAASILVCHLIGKEKANMLGVYPGPGCLGHLFPAFLTSIFRLGERLEDRIGEQAFEELIEWLSRQSVKAMISYFDNYKQRHFQVPEVLKKAWDIKA